ncbi:MAG: thioesterase family protein [Hyphomicrobiaceae bacterium]
MAPRPLQGYEFAETITPHEASFDVNRHVNVGYYGVFFDLAADVWMHRHEMTEHYITTQQRSMFISESRTRYFREVTPGGKMDIYFRVHDLSPKAILGHLVMLDPETGEFIAALEALWLSVDLKTRKVSPFEPVIYDEFARVQAEHHREVPDVPFTGMIAFRK